MSLVDEFFEINVAPSDFEEVMASVADFIKYHPGKRIAVVTSGGTMVPIEKRTVRFLDNFSGGRRGAASAEYFLAHDYAVIFLHRRFTVQPYSRRFMITATTNFLDFLVQGPESSVHVIPEWAVKLQEVLTLHNQIKEKNTLLKVGFGTVGEYLWLLRGIAQLVNARNSLLYCAAAVSDFYIRPSEMVEHKISNADGLTLKLDNVPKMLDHLFNVWAPQSFAVSFKLETDSNLLEPKAQKALKEYGHELVIGNLLHNYPDRVVYFQTGKEPLVVERSPKEIEDSVDIEEKMIPLLIDLHSSYINELSV